MSGPAPTPAADARGRRFCIVAALWNEEHVRRLVDGATGTLRDLGAGADSVEVVWVPGSFELPLAARWAAESGRFDAVLAFGVLLRGETEHFRLIAGAATRGLMQVMLETGVPVLHGVLAAHDVAQVAARTGGAHGNRGAEVAAAAARMAAVRGEIAARG